EYMSSMAPCSGTWLYRMLASNNAARRGEKSMADILVVGSLNMDQVVRVPRIPGLGETLLGAGSLRLVPGGKGANQAVAMARLGAAVIMAGGVGRDGVWEQDVQWPEGGGVDERVVGVDLQEASGTAFIFLAPDGDNAIVVAS